MAIIRKERLEDIPAVRYVNERVLGIPVEAFWFLNCKKAFYATAAALSATCF